MTEELPETESESEAQGVDVAVGSSNGSSSALSGDKIAQGTPFSRPNRQHLHRKSVAVNFLYLFFVTGVENPFTTKGRMNCALSLVGRKIN